MVEMVNHEALSSLRHRRMIKIRGDLVSTHLLHDGDQVGTCLAVIVVNFDLENFFASQEIIKEFC